MLKVGQSIPLERLRGLWRSRPISSLFLWQYWQYRGGDFWIIKQYRYIFRHMIPPAPPDLLISARLPEWARENACDTVILMFCTRNTEDNLPDFHRNLKIYIYFIFCRDELRHWPCAWGHNPDSHAHMHTTKHTYIHVHIHAWTHTFTNM